MSRTGIGFDAHAFASGAGTGPSEGEAAPESPDAGGDRALVIGGVTIDGHPGLLGHSDADVLSHAIADALLGAANLGDLGSRFPDDDLWRDASSLLILEQTAGLVAGAGYAIEHVDASVVAEAPRLAPHRAAMRANVAHALGIPEDSVSIKATTTDGLGFTGRGDGIAALAVATIERTGPESGQPRT